MRKLTRFITPIIVLALAMPGLVSVANAQGAQEEVIEEIITTGFRGKPRSSVDSAVPIDVFNASAIEAVSHTDLQNILQTLIPSYNVSREPISDGSSFIRAATLRGLPSHHTLVLVNGKRRHRAALVVIGGSGTQGPDVATIPSLAVQSIEVLRDGASAQYGSDAIAGVINFNLKNNTEGFSLLLDSGTTYEGDGDTYTLAGNIGLPLGDNGFLNATIEHSTADQTSRGTVRFDCPDRIAAVGVENVPLDGLCQRWGDPDIETLKGFLNFGVDINDNTEFFGNASFGDNEFRSDFFYRPGVILGTGGAGALMVDDGTGNPADAPQALLDSITGAGLNLADYLTADAGSATGWALLNPIESQFPGGFNPDFGADISDYSVLLGVRGETAGGLRWDVRGRIAENEAVYLLGSTINPSLGLLSPTNFKPGALTQEETAFTVDFVKTFDVGTLASPLNVAFGAEWREETYTLEAGDPASIEVGPTFLDFGFGSESFQGYPLESVVTFDVA
ncbi:MAG: TonB-dependent receptor plug domain-containing protein, partial [Proteobacteria bacterium]|nr:TonB-dependent receptor plug domain-containing protein [Pseudomonadota bacterium]